MVILGGKEGPLGTQRDQSRRNALGLEHLCRLHQWCFIRDFNPGQEGTFRFVWRNHIGVGQQFRQDFLSRRRVQDRDHVVGLGRLEGRQGHFLWRFKLRHQEVDFFHQGIEVLQVGRRHGLVGAPVDHDVILAVGIQGYQSRPGPVVGVITNVAGVDTVGLQGFTHELPFGVRTDHPNKVSLRTRPRCRDGLVGTLAPRSRTLILSSKRLPRFRETFHVVGGINVDTSKNGNLVWHTLHLLLLKWSNQSRYLKRFTYQRWC